MKAQAQAFAGALSTIGKFMIKKKVGDKDQIYGRCVAAWLAGPVTGQVYCRFTGGRLGRGWDAKCRAPYIVLKYVSVY